MLSFSNTSKVVKLLTGKNALLKDWPTPWWVETVLHFTSLSFLPSSHHLPKGVISSLYIRYFFLLVWHNSWQKWLKEDRVYLDSQSKGMRSFAVGGRHGRASKRCLVTATVRKQRTRDTDAQLALFFLFRSAHGMGPFSVRGGHSSTINLNPLINMPRKLFP